MEPRANPHVFVVKFRGIINPAILLAIQRDPKYCVKLCLAIKRDHTYEVRAKSSRTVFIKTHTLSPDQGCGVGVEAGVGVARSRPFCLESESELESVKLCRLRLRPGVAGYQTSADNDFGRMFIFGPKALKDRKKRRAVAWR